MFVSPVGLGTWATGGTVETWGRVDDNESISAIRRAVELGINLIDTAPIYGLGHSEEVIGLAIKGIRDQVVLASKCGVRFPRTPDEKPWHCLRRDSIVKECEDSLRRLGVETIDLYQCHWPDPDTPVEETRAALDTLMQQGKIRVVGVSNFSCQQMSEMRAVGPIHSLQPSFSLVDRRAADDLLPYCKEYDIGVICYSPLCKGLLTGKFGPDDTFDDVRGRDPEFKGEKYAKNLELVRCLEPIAARHGKTVAQLAINWVINYPGVTAAIVGFKRSSQVEENIGGTGWSLTEGDSLEIEQMLG